MRMNGIKRRTNAQRACAACPNSRPIPVDMRKPAQGVGPRCLKRQRIQARPETTRPRCRGLEVFVAKRAIERW
jgi:hypothetical protein